MRRTILILAILLLLPALAVGQGYTKDKKAQADEAKIQLQAERFAIGGGSFFDEESVTFSTQALFLAVQWHGIGLPVVREGTSTGLALELHPANLFGFEDPLSIQGVHEVDYRLWSTTRMPISAVPVRALESGTPGKMFVGTDLLLAEGGPDDFTKGFDARFVIGGDLGRAGPGNVVLEIYSLQKDIPIAFAFFYGF